MSDNIEFNFDKFVNDIEKRENAYKERKSVEETSLQEEMLKRRRDELYRERWQNRITWEGR
jgi:hypothetical protein